MRKLRIGAAVVAFLVGVSFLVAFSLPRTKFLGRVVPTAQTVGNVSLDIGFVNVPDNSVIHAQARIEAIDLATGNSKVWNVQAGFKRFVGILSLIGHKVEVELEVGDPITGQWEAIIDFDDVTDQLCIRIDGAAGATIEWMADFQFNVYQP